MNFKRNLAAVRDGFMPRRCLPFVLLVLSGGLFFSCATGRYMAMSQSEHAEVLGTVQSTFIINSSFRYRSAINMQSYITLLAEAQKKYPDANVDIRDISWVIGRQFDPGNYEYTALGKVIRRP